MTRNASASPAATGPVDPLAEREAIAARMAVDGHPAAAAAIMALGTHTPLGDPIARAIAAYTDDIDELLLALGDAAARGTGRTDA